MQNLIQTYSELNPSEPPAFVKRLEPKLLWKQGISARLLCTVKGSPVLHIVDKAPSISVTAGDSATLECTVSGSPDLKVKWLRDGKEMTTSRKYKISFKENVACLKILSSFFFTLSLYQKLYLIILWLFWIIFILKKVDSNVGASVQMDCKVSGSQPMTVSWFKEGKEITPGEKYQIEFRESTATLKISHLETSDAGVFTCRATNAAGHSETSGTVSVKEPPVFTLKPESQEVIPGSTVVLKAAFTGTAPFAIKWFREEKEILTGGNCFIKKEASSSTLELHTVKPSHSAKYTCQVANDAGKVSCTAVVFVKGAVSCFL
uniref:Ig-like domain-containing protein n=1 Tax=Astyanax mexicanus TaxID=7994 RepID=A0A3B1IJP5_ASTMX